MEKNGGKKECRKNGEKMRSGVVVKSGEKE